MKSTFGALAVLVGVLVGAEPGRAVVTGQIFGPGSASFPISVMPLENLGGDVEQVLNRRCLIGVFPWKFGGGESSIARVVAYLPEDEWEERPAPTAARA